MITLQNLDFSKTYTLEQKVNLDDPTDLHKHGMSKFPGATTLLTASYNPTTRKFRTGLDVNAQEVLEIMDSAKKQEAINLITEVKKELESYYGTPGILDSTSSFWDGFGIPITVGRNRETFIDLGGLSKILRPSLNPLHKLALIVIRANDSIPISKNDASSPDYRDCQFVFTTEEEETKLSAASVKTDIARSTQLGKLFGDDIQYERAWEIAYFLGLAPKKDCSSDKLQEDLYTATKEISFAKKFIAACLLSNDEIITANIFKRAIKLNLVKYNGTDKTYFRGGINYRQTEEDSIELLKTPAMATELAQLRESVLKKSKNVKQF